MGVRAEVADALALGAAHHLDPRVLLVERDGQVGVALVVAVLDVEPRVELLDPGVLELQRLDLGGRRRSTPPTRPWSPSSGCAGAGRPGPGSTSRAAAAGSWPCRRR